MQTINDNEADTMRLFSQTYGKVAALAMRMEQTRPRNGFDLLKSEAFRATSCLNKISAEIRQRADIAAFDVDDFEISDDKVVFSAEVVATHPKLVAKFWCPACLDYHWHDLPSNVDTEALASCRPACRSKSSPWYSGYLLRISKGGE